MAPYSFTIARALMTKAQVICARSKENISVFDFYDVNMSTKSKTDSFLAFPSVIFFKLCGVVTTYISYKIPYYRENLSELI